MPLLYGLLSTFFFNCFLSVFCMVLYVFLVVFVCCCFVSVRAWWWCFVPLMQLQLHAGCWCFAVSVDVAPAINAIIAAQLALLHPDRFTAEANAQMHDDCQST